MEDEQLKEKKVHYALPNNIFTLCGAKSDTLVINNTDKVTCEKCRRIVKNALTLNTNKNKL